MFYSRLFSLAWDTLVDFGTWNTTPCDHNLYSPFIGYKYAYTMRLRLFLTQQVFGAVTRELVFSIIEAYLSILD